MNCFDLREILTQSDFDEMLVQERAVLSFYFNWSGQSVNGIQYFKEADKQFLNKDNSAINFWLADMSYTPDLTGFLVKWIMRTPPISKVFGMIRTGNPTVIWLNFGQVLSCGLPANILKTNGIIEKTIEYFNL
jgi:hypothetical protein